jgi:hypothetical protein
MPTITVYLTNDLYLKVKDAPSKIIKMALQHYFTEDEKDPVEASSQPNQQPCKPSNSQQPTR